MNIPQLICPICNKPIEEGQSRFYFPKLHPSHELADLHGVLHLDCIRSIDRSRHVGQALAVLTAELASHSKTAPLLLRDGNIILRDFRLDESRIEIADYENFCEISLPINSLKNIQESTSKEAIALGLQILHINQDQFLEIEFKKPAFTVDLPTLSFSRFVSMLIAANVLQ
ncbi:hypothetical protein [Variovorax sp. CF313]|uniref:hypothetical protein n=1 Tax=Variovorax sp. CF313 TaxID=1144315 RepID=UPI0012F9EDB1|nr:hypothetical protein [Variovorax sp. CF313]